jgi:hypothetical protein
VDRGPLLCNHLYIGRISSNPKDVVFPHRKRMTMSVLKSFLTHRGRVFYYN